MCVKGAAAAADSGRGLSRTDRLSPPPTAICAAIRRSQRCGALLRTASAGNSCQSKSAVAPARWWWWCDTTGSHTWSHRRNCDLVTNCVTSNQHYLKKTTQTDSDSTSFSVSKLTQLPTCSKRDVTDNGGGGRATVSIWTV